MIRFVLRRLLLMLPMVLVALTVTFVMVQMAPGSPFSSQRRLPPEIEANLKAKYGFDQPKLVQYGRFMARLVGFRYGPSSPAPSWLLSTPAAATAPIPSASVDSVVYRL
jgi:oligopeptide transport system permease protein